MLSCFQSLTSPELQHLVGNGASFQLASGLSLSPIALPHIIQPPAFAPQPFHQTVVHQPSILQHQVLPHRSIIPQQFSLQVSNIDYNKHKGLYFKYVFILESHKFKI